MPNHDLQTIVTVDAALFTIVDGSLNLVLIERAAPPFEGRLALIGGYIHPEDDLSISDAVHRVIRDKAGLKDVFIEQLASFGGPVRDPRGWSVSIAYYALVPPKILASTAGGGVPLKLTPVDRRPRLPFDHDAIVDAALARLSNKSSYSSLPTFLLPDEFSFPELKSVYETVTGTALNDSAFRRKIGDLKFIEEVPDGRSVATAQRKRPAQLYRRRGGSLVEFDRTV
jgi:8-oxo-dGTP diphosphatase